MSKESHIDYQIYKVSFLFFSCWLAHAPKEARDVKLNWPPKPKLGQAKGPIWRFLEIKLFLIQVGSSWTSDEILLESRTHLCNHDSIVHEFLRLSDNSQRDGPVCQELLAEQLWHPGARTVQDFEVTSARWHKFSTLSADLKPWMFQSCRSCWSLVLLVPRLSHWNTVFTSLRIGR